MGYRKGFLVNSLLLNSVVLLSFFTSESELNLILWLLFKELIKFSLLPYSSIPAFTKVFQASTNFFFCSSTVNLDAEYFLGVESGITNLLGK